MQVWSVEHPAEDAIRTGVVGVKQSLIGHAVRRDPHAQEEEEEEDVFHLDRGEGSSRSRYNVNPARKRFGKRKYTDESHHLAENDDFRSQLFVNGEDVNETEGEDHVVQTHDTSAKSIRPLKHPVTQAE